MKLIQKIGISLFLLTISLQVVAQEKQNKFSLLLELAGNSGFYSIYGEYEIGKLKDYQFNTRCGFGYIPTETQNIVVVPIGLTVFTGKKSHHLECGLGATYTNVKDKFIRYSITDPSVVESGDAERIYFVPSIGYRYDKLTGGVIFKAYYSPMFKIFDFKGTDRIKQIANQHVIFFGLSIGYRFK